jgi:FSR family fosmidomycin resistance protein-like MFS transporter
MPTVAAVRSAAEQPAAVTLPDVPAAQGVTGGARLTWVVGSHAVVDFLSFVIIPIMSLLEHRASFTHQEGAVLLAVGSVASGVIQPLVAIISDRFDTRWLGTAGLLVAAAAISLVGYVDTFPQLLLLQALGAGGIGAFHPVAAAAAGQMSGKRRAGGIAIFYSAGMAGAVAGGMLVPSWVAAWGIKSLSWLLVPGVLTAVALGWAIHSVPHRHATAHADHAALPPHERRRRWRDVVLLYSGNVIRFTVNMMLVQLIIRWSEQRALARAGSAELTEGLRLEAASLNGPLQASMSIGMGIAGMIVAFAIRPRSEKSALVFVPLAGAAAVAAFPYAGPVWAAFLLALAGGIGYAGVIPITISMAQRLLPHRTSLASGLMMGGAWSLAAAGPPVAQWLAEHAGLGNAFLAAAGLLLTTVVLALPLTRAR